MTARVLTLVTMAVVLAVVAVGALVAFLDPNQFKDRLCGLISQGLGREVRIEGDIEYGFKPLLAFVLNDVVIMQPPGFGGEPFARVGRMWVEINPVPLLDRRLEALSGGGEDAVLRLVRNATGGDNYSDLLLNMARYKGRQSGLEETGRAGRFFESVSLPALRVENATFEYLDRVDKAHFSVLVADFRLGKAKAGEPVDFNLSLAFSKARPDVSLTAHLKGLAVMDKDLDVIGVEQCTATTRFAWGLPSGEALAGDVTARFRAELANGTLVVAEDFTARGPGLSASGKGTATWRRGELSGRGRVSARLDDPRKAAAVFFPGGAPIALAGLKGAAVSGDVEAGPDLVRVDNLDLSALGTRLSGSASILPGSAPRLDFDLAADVLNLKALEKLAPKGTSASWEDVLSALGRPAGLEARGRLAVERFEDYAPAAFTAQGGLAADGGLDLALAAEGMLGGRANLDLKLASRAAGGGAALAARLRDADVGAVFRELGLERTASGRGDLDLSLATGLAEPRTMIQRAEAKLSAVWRDLVLAREKGAGDLRLSRAELRTELRKAKPLNDALTTFSFPLDARIFLEDGKARQSLDLSVAGKALADLKAEWLRLASGRMRARLVLPGLPERAPAIELASSLRLDTAEDEAEFTDLRLKLLGEDVSGRATVRGLLGGELAYWGRAGISVERPREVLALAGVELPAMRDPQALARLSMASDFNGTEQAVTLRSLNGVADATTFSGDLTVSRFHQPVFAFDIKAGSLDLDRYMPGPAPEEAAPEQAEPEPFDMAALRLLDGRGRLDVADLRFSDMAFGRVKAEFTARPGGILVKEIDSNFYGGQFEARVRAMASGDTLAMNLNMEARDFQAGPFLTDLAGDDYVRGRSDVRFDLRSSGLTSVELLKNLRGSASFAVRDGSYNFQDSQPPASNRDQGMMNAQEPREKRTVFSKAGASFSVARGVFSSRDFKLDSTLLTTTGQGNFSLPANSIDVHLSVDLVGAPKVPVVISGLLSDPDVHVPKGKFLGGAVRGIVDSIFRPYRFMRDLILY